MHARPEAPIPEIVLIHINPGRIRWSGTQPSGSDRVATLQQSADFGEIAMDRRQVGKTLLLGALATGFSTSAFAQMGGAPVGEAERDHATNTLKVGSLALKTSQLAQGKASGAPVKDFANFEVDEQTTIAQIIQESTGMAPPPPDEKAQAIMDRLSAASGRAFNTSYIAAQIDGHQQLLTIQERYLASGRDPATRHVAMLAKGQIKEHLKLLSDLRTTSHL